MATFSIRRREKIQMNFTGSPQCGNAGDMNFDISVTGMGAQLDENGFVFDSVHLAELFDVLREGRWHGSCEGIGLFCAKWLFERDAGMYSVETEIITESGNRLWIYVDKYGVSTELEKAIRQVNNPVSERAAKRK